MIPRDIVHLDEQENERLVKAFRARQLPVQGVPEQLLGDDVLMPSRFATRSDALWF